MKTILSAVAFAGVTAFAASCTTSTNHDQVISAQRATIDSMRTEMAKQRVIDSMNRVAALREEIRKEEEAKQAAVAASSRSTSSTSRARRSSSSSSSNYNSYTGSGYSNTAAQPVVYQEAPARKRGWSAKAKGAVIGAGTGAASGAIINKRNRAAGAVIGGVLGAGVGTGVGAVIDRKNGR